MIEQLLFALAPIALVGLIADREVETLQAPPDRIAQQLTQVRGARAEARNLAVVVACENVEIAIAEGEPEIERRPGRADIKAAQVNQRAEARRGGKLAVERHIAGAREQVRHAHAGESLALLLDQYVERERELGARVRIDELDRSELTEPLELGAVAPARR